MFITYLEFCGITLSVETDWDAYHDFLNLYLKNFVSSPTSNPGLRIRSLFPRSLANPQYPRPFSHENMRRAGPDAFFDEGRICCRRGNCNIFVQFSEDGSILLHCEDHMRLRRLRSVRAAIGDAIGAVLAKSRLKVHAAFQTHMRLTVHYPLFWLMETRRGLHLLHGAGVRMNGGGIILSGLATVGKTTLAAFLYFNHPGTDVLTDNFLLYDRERIYAFPEASRLNREGIEVASAQSLMDEAFVLGRRYHWVPRKPCPFDAVPKKAFLVCSGRDLRVERISSELFAETALGLNDVVQEFHNYSYIGLFPFAARRSFDTYVSRAQSLKSCVRDADCAVLTIPNVSSLADIRQGILEAVQPPAS